MSRTVYVNSAFVPEEEATVSIFDRGFLFADAVYEVTSVVGGKLIDYAGHMQRLRRSLGELEMPSPLDDEALLGVHRELVARNGIDEGLVYLQVTRGNAGDRDFVFPPAETAPTLVMFTQTKSVVDSPIAVRGIKVVSMPDIRWGRCDIKTVQLLASAMAKMEAKHHHVDDAWMVRDGLVTEGSSNNAYIVTEDGTIVTRERSQSILHGITRAAILRLAEESGLTVEERGFSIEEAQAAQEAFITSATTFVHPVIEIDGARVGGGQPGPVARRLREIYIEESLKTAI
ncbi:D-amino-acid transaminase [Consotaella aegiceratis]|uniref:D-amino-acid transaminase n=1 Tax=Consotaella aegiceratis TaxID=3097961 RepID=UPI002F3F633C